MPAFKIHQPESWSGKGKQVNINLYLIVI